MKRILSVILCAAVLLSALCVIPFVSAENNQNDNTLVSGIDVSPLTVEKSSGNGYVSAENGALKVVGKKLNGTATASGTAYSKPLTSEQLTDFTVSYVYKPSGAAWNRDVFTLRTDGNITKGYQICVYGSSIEVNSKKVTRIFVSKDYAGWNTESSKIIIPDENLAEVTLAANKEYNIEASVKDYTVKVWFWEKGKDKPSEPTVTYTDSEKTYSSGSVMFGSYWDGAYSVSDITLKNDKTGDYIAEDYNPVIYNTQVASNYKNGTVTYTDKGVRIDATSPIWSEKFETRTNGLLSSLGKKVKEFDLTFTYTPKTVDAVNEDKLLFNSDGTDGAGYYIGIKQDGLTLYRQGVSVNSVAYTFTADTAYKFELSVSGGTANLFVYAANGVKPENATLTYTDESPLSSGDIFLATATGNFTVSGIKICGDSGPLYTEDFEGTTYSGLSVEGGKTEIEKVKAGDNNSALSVKFVADSTGQGFSNLKITPDTQYKNFTFNADIKVTSIGNTNWSFLMLATRSQANNNFNNSINLRIGANGSQFTAANAAKGLTYTNNSMVVSGKTYNSASRLPDDDPDGGIKTDGMWHKFSVVGDGHTYKFYLDGELQLTVKDSDKLYKQGYFYLVGRNVNYLIDNIEIYDMPDMNTDKEPEVINYNVVYDFEDGMPEEMAVVGSSTATVVTENGNSYLTVNPRPTDTSNGFAQLQIRPGIKYGDFTFNANIRVSKEFNSQWHFLMLAFRSQSNTSYENANIWQLAAGGSCFTVANKEKGWLYNNHRIGISGTGSTINNSAALPNGDALGGISADGEWHKISISAEGNVYRFYLDGKLKLEVTDTDNIYSEGYFYLVSRDIEFDMDNVELYDAPDQNISYTVTDSADSLTGVVYKNDFESEDCLDTVTMVLGNKEKSGLVTENGDTFYRVYHDESKSSIEGTVKLNFDTVKTTHFTLSYDVRLLQLTNSEWHFLSTYVRTQGSNYYEVQILQNGTCIDSVNPAMGYTNSNHKLALSGPTKGGLSPNPNHSSKCGLTPDDEWHKVSVVGDGYTISVYIDGVFILKAEDTEQLYRKGGFMLGGWGCSFDLDNVSLSAETYYDLQPTRTVTDYSGVIYTNDFESDDALSLVNIIYADDAKSGIVSEDGNKFLRLFGETKGTSTYVDVSFGPKNVRNFTLEFKLRIKYMPNVSWSYAVAGFHANAENTFEDSIQAMLLGRGTAFLAKNAAAGLTHKNVIATTGKNLSEQSPYPTDNRAYGLRPDGYFHTVKVVCSGTQYTVYVDNNKYLSVNDTSDLYEKGITYIGGLNINIDIDDIKLSN